MLKNKQKILPTLTVAVTFSLYFDYVNIIQIHTHHKQTKRLVVVQTQSIDRPNFFLVWPEIFQMKFSFLTFSLFLGWINKSLKKIFEKLQIKHTCANGKRCHFYSHLGKKYKVFFQIKKSLILAIRGLKTCPDLLSLFVIQSKQRKKKLLSDQISEFLVEIAEWKF